MSDVSVSILENKKINAKYYKLIFESAELSRKVLPGQFLNVQLTDTLDPYLRRPFSYYRVTGRRIEVLYEILGRGTALLSQMSKGAPLQINGPLGLPFRATLAKGKKRILIAGGVGVPPLIFLAEKVKSDYLLIGTKSKAEVLPKSELANVKAKVLYSTNDGSYGVQGFVTTLLEQILKKEKPENLFIQTCGPNVMMQAVMKIAQREGIDGEASIDKTMACGVGACLGCMVMTTDGWLPSCTQGPVFSFNRLEYQIR
jgi:dihydroorotate dehydrogenase electron transfer subunit